MLHGLLFLVLATAIQYYYSPIDNSFTFHIFFQASLISFFTFVPSAIQLVHVWCINFLFSYEHAKVFALPDFFMEGWNLLEGIYTISGYK